MSPLPTTLAQVWVLVVLLILCVTLVVYIGSRRTERWRDARGWVVLLFSLGVTRISAGLVTLLLRPSAPTSEETGDFIMTVGTGLLLAGGAWILNNRHRAKRDQEQQAAIHERQQTAPRPSP